MIRLLYISSTRQPLEDRELDGILAVSRRNNARDRITGLLVTGRRRFLQVLEGPREAVERAYQRIAADPRHHALVRLGAADIEERTFGDWAMGRVAGGDGDTVTAMTAPIADPTLRAYFDGFVTLHRAA